MIQAWKVRHMLTGMLTFVPILNAWRQRHASTGGADSARYCYSVWFRHLSMLDQHGFKIKGAQVGELGPGDSLGLGLAALLAGAKGYTGLDIVPYSATSGLENIFEELVEMYLEKTPLPDDSEFPFVRPRIDSYDFPNHLTDSANLALKAETLRQQIRVGLNNSLLIDYRVPWTLLPQIREASLDLIFSQAVLEHVDNLNETYQAMYAWLKPNGYASHVIDFRAHGRSPYWNGHWAYSDWQWKLVRGKREFLLNREPISTHIAHAKRAGFQVLLLKEDQAPHRLEISALASRFQRMTPADARTSGVFVILRKPK